MPSAELPEMDVRFSLTDRRDLQAELATVFSTQRAIEAILRLTTFPRGRIPSFANSSADEVWGEILLLLELGAIRAGNYQLLTAVIRPYPANPVFRRLAETYLRPIAGSLGSRTDGEGSVSLSSAESSQADGPKRNASLPAKDIRFSLADRRHLQDALAVVFNSQPAVESILRSTTFPRGRIPSFENSSADEAWGEILLELELGAIPAGNFQLLTAVIRPYPANPVFRQLAETYLGLVADSPSAAADQEVEATRPTAWHVIVRANTAEEQEQAARRLWEFGLNPVEQWSTANSTSYRISSGNQWSIRAKLEQAEFGWTLVAPWLRNYLMHTLYIEGPDGRQFRITDSPAQQTVGDLVAELIGDYLDSAGGARPAVVDRVGSAGQGRRLDLNSTLDESGVSDGDHIRLGFQSGPELVGHAFISYVREDSVMVDRMQRILELAGVRV